MHARMESGRQAKLRVQECDGARCLRGKRHQWGKLPSLVDPTSGKECSADAIVQATEQHVSLQESAPLQDKWDGTKETS